ncbi:MAG: hypothetical protein JWO13_1822 [Acidobacteriales bacterium]|nr:hypothetical protein [Terriglobales bacterium]
MIWVFISLYLLVGVGTAAIWYFWSVRSNRQRAVQILYWIENALGKQGHVTGIRWHSVSEFEVPVRMASKLFRKSSILVKISSYRIPINWLLARINEPEAETLTFQADLDLHPTFNLELQNRRWFARSQKNLNVEGPGWQFEGCVPVVLTTRLDWQKELTTAIQSVLAVDQRENLQVQFRQSSPHFTATVPLDAITPESQMAVFDLLGSIVSRASAKAS